MKAAGGARMAEKKRKRDEGEARKEDRAEVASQIERSVAEMQKGGPNTIEKSGGLEGRRSSMAAEEMNAERARDEYRGMAKTWKDGYLQGLDACLQWQAENERLIKDSFKQGLSGSRQFLTWWKDWIEDQTQRQADAQRQANAPNPLLGFTKQSTEAVVATVEPLLKNSEAAVESSFGYYENAVATPSRKFVREINKQVLDAVIST
jgi:hypothetical protein